MARKTLALALAAACAAPAAALAQSGSGLTIGGFIGATVDNLSYKQAAATRTTTSEQRLSDDSSRLIFNVREDLGGDAYALVRVDLRPNIDNSTITAAGVSYVGLSTHSGGRFTLGRHNFHRYKTPWDGWPMFGQLRVRPDALIDFAAAGSVAIANASRTPNSIMWSSPRWGGFAMDAGYSFNANGPTVAEADMTAGNTARKGRAWNVNPTFTGSNWHIAYTHWDSKADAPTFGVGAPFPDQLSDSVYGYIAFGGLKVGALWNTTDLEAATVGTKVSERTAWSIPVRYTVGRHNFLAHYTVARDDKATAAEDGAKMYALMYAHSLSKRTNVNVAYARVTNDAGAAYNFYSNASGAAASINAAPAAGEDGRLIAIGIRHNY